ncbi:phage portal protein [Dyella ginsengisoli]|uniref:Phage portal protein n=1 Tax=Dyella ginsengisoli TaxID=363848 RepID=A0ABW8JVT8_9GAMM
MFGQRRRSPASSTLTERGQQLAAAIDQHKAERIAPAVRRPQGGMRRFDGAVVNRLTATWQSVNVAIDAELRTDLDRLRARSRDLFKNNEYAVKFGRAIRSNVVGPEGFRFRADVKDPSGKADEGANKAIEKAFATWCRPEQCDVAGKRSFIDLCDAIGLALGRDGEFMLRKRRGAGAGTFGYQLQLLDMDRLDTFYNLWPADGRNAVIMGVEIDQWRKPVAYHLWNRHYTESPTVTRYRERVPASEIIHGFIPLEDEQTRGVPWMHAVMRRLNDLNGYREAAVIAARIGASKMGFFTSPDGDPAPVSNGVDGVTPDTKGEFITEATPGSFDVLPEGYGFEAFNPDYPHQQFESFNKAALRGVASGLPGMSYHSLNNDLEGVSFSSIRSGTLEEREDWMKIQKWVITQVLVPVYEDWLEMALLAGAITLANGSPLPLAKKAKFQDHIWRGRRWQWVDPLKDMAAAVLAIENGLSSPERIADQQGIDIEDVINDIARFQAMLKAKGVVLAGTTAPTGTIASAVAESGNDGGSSSTGKAGKKARVLQAASTTVADLVALLQDEPAAA